LTNASDIPESGTIEFFNQGTVIEDAALLEMTVDGVTRTTFRYSIPPHAATRLVTAGSSGAVRAGSVRITAENAFSIDQIPVAQAILSLRNGGVTVSEVGVSAPPIETEVRMYMDASGSPGQIGSIQSGLVIANPAARAVTASIELTGLDGTSVSLPPATISVPAHGQVTKLINEIFPELPMDFHGIAHVTGTSSMSVTALRGRSNERGDFLMTTTPPLKEATTLPRDLVLPLIVKGLGYSTEITVFGQAGLGTLSLFDQEGMPGSSLTSTKE